jgi:hypothetical protein
LAYNFVSSRTTHAAAFQVAIFFIWSVITLNGVLIHRFHIINIEKLNHQNSMEQHIQESTTPSISLERLNRFFIQFSTWVPSSLRIQKIDINPEYIKVYGHADDEKMFSRLWKHFKTQDWVHQLRLLKWELQSASRWIFAFQVNM